MEAGGFGVSLFSESFAKMKWSIRVWGQELSVAGGAKISHVDLELGAVVGEIVLPSPVMEMWALDESSNTAFLTEHATNGETLMRSVDLTTGTPANAIAVGGRGSVEFLDLVIAGVETDPTVPGEYAVGIGVDHEDRHLAGVK